MIAVDFDDIGEPIPNRKEGANAAAYMLVHLPTGLVYFGSSGDVARRIADHKRQLQAGTHPVRQLQENFREGGEVIARVLQITDDATSAKNIEQEYLDANVGKPHCLNVAINAHAAASGLTRTAETRRLMSEAHRNIPLHSNSRLALEDAIRARSTAVVIEGRVFESYSAAGGHYGIHRDTVKSRVQSSDPEFKDWALRGW
jgi:hypothetical protein